MNRFVVFEHREKNRFGKFIKTDRTELLSFTPSAATGQ